MSVDSENKTNKTMAPYTSSDAEPENGVDAETLPEFSEDINFTGEITPVTPEFVLRLPTITNGTRTICFHFCSTLKIVTIYFIFKSSFFLV